MTTVADLTRPGRSAARDSRLWFYSYGYSEDSVETRIAGVTPADIADSVMFLVDDGDFFVGQVLMAAAGAVV